MDMQVALLEVVQKGWVIKKGAIQNNQLDLMNLSKDLVNKYENKNSIL